MSEWASRAAANPEAVEADGTTTGDIVLVGSAFNIAMGQFISEKVEVAARYTTLIFDEVTGADPTQVNIPLDSTNLL
jgi:phosphate-selective porin OprO/OprP